MDIEKLIERLRSYTYWLGQDGPESHDIHPLICDEAATALSALQAENEKLRAELDAARAALAELTGLADGSVQTLFGVPLERMWELSQAELEGRIVLRSAGAGRREVSSLRERLAAGGWIDPAVELPPDDDMVLAIVSGKPASNITLKDAYELASYGSEGWIVEQYELWETPTVTWWRPLPDPPEKKKEER